MFDDTTTQEEREALARLALDRMASNLMAAMSTRDGRDSVQRDHATVGAALASRPAPEEAGLLVLINEAITRLHASSIPLGMSEAQFNAATIADVLRILTRPLPAPAPVGEVEESDLPNGHAPVDQLSGFLARRIVAPVGEVEREELARVLYVFNPGRHPNEAVVFDFDHPSANQERHTALAAADTLLSEFTVSRKVVS